MDVVTLKQANAYTDKTVVGLGGLKGAPCTVQSVSETVEDGKAVGKTVTLKWAGTDGTVQTVPVFLPYGKDATINGVNAVRLDEISNYDLIKLWNSI